jgi:hypothetical protein
MNKEMITPMSKVRPLFFVLFFVFIVFAYSCTKEGPAGPAGATGATGATGVPGPAGSANVIYSDWFTPNPYVLTTVFGMKNFDFNQAAPGISQDILDKGEVLVYGKLLGYVPSIWPAGQVSKLPISLTYISGSQQTDTWSGYATAGNLRINFVNSANLYTSISTSHTFRYILIPGGVSGSTANLVSNSKQKSAKVDFKSMTYEQVCDYLKIPK